jgi:hypothetical protein
MPALPYYPYSLNHLGNSASKIPLSVAGAILTPKRKKSPFRGLILGYLD